MTDALSLIKSLGREGKRPQEIARELHARGVKDARGRTITPAVVEGFLRFSDLPPDDRFAGGVWGSGGPPPLASEIGPHDAPKPRKKRKNRWNPGKALTDELREKITRMYQNDCMRVSEIAAELGVDFRRIQGFCAFLSGFSMPPGEVSEFVDEQGRRVTRCPPGYAYGAMPQRNVRPTRGGY
jgi:hypothetical protein